MTESILTSTGWVAWMAVFAVTLFVTLWLSTLAAREAFRKLLRLYRLATIWYWLDRMEADGTLVMAREYREMVKERDPKTRQDFIDIDREIEGLTLPHTKGE